MNTRTLRMLALLGLSGCGWPSSAECEAVRSESWEACDGRTATVSGSLVAGSTPNVPLTEVSPKGFRTQVAIDGSGSTFLAETQEALRCDGVASFTGLLTTELDPDGTRRSVMKDAVVTCE
ncbi:MAG: hypothetical protein EP330_15830 [Deltaproteobacteria bacterium]|nr:MAG: hypothetical protein EP330_15830 [Deltaproteobacteria bacterium]